MEDQDNVAEPQNGDPAAAPEGQNTLPLEDPTPEGKACTCGADDAPAESKGEASEPAEGGGEDDDPASMEPASKEIPLIEEIYQCREVLQEIGQRIRDVRLRDDFFPLEDSAESGNMMDMADNVELSYRHVEDAKMRLGKVMQAFNGGKSINPR